jgi:hypothetical protein
MTTPRLGAPELVSGQAVPETTVNEQIRYLESGAGHFIFKDRDLATPPGSPADGDCYLVATSPTGAWSGKAGKIAFYLNTAWVFITAIEGLTAWINDENVFVGYDGATWSTLSSPSGSYQPLDDELTAIAGLTSAADKIPYFTGSAAAALLTRDTDGTLAGNSDTKLATQKAVKTYVDAAVSGATGTYNDESAQDAIGTILVDSSTIDFTYSDATPSITASVIASAVKPTESLIVACSDETTAITAGTAKVTFRMPYAFTVSAVRASVTTAPTGSTILIDINESGTTILSTKLMIDASEKTSTTAATAAVISDSSLADDAEITIDFDQVGSTIAGAGVKVYLIGTRT